MFLGQIQHCLDVQCSFLKGDEFLVHFIIFGFKFVDGTFFDLYLVNQSNLLFTLLYFQLLVVGPTLPLR